MALPHVRVGGHIGRGNSRLTPVRRRLYEPKWSTQRIPAQASRDTLFFRQQSSIDRLSNIEQSGVISVHESATVFKILLLPWFGTSEAEQIAFHRVAVMELTIQKDKAYKLLAATQQAAVGFAGNTSLAGLGEPASKKATSLGEVDIGAGETFDVRFVYPSALNTQRDQILTVMLESMFDEPVS